MRGLDTVLVLTTGSLKFGIHMSSRSRLRQDLQITVRDSGLIVHPMKASLFNEWACDASSWSTNAPPTMTWGSDTRILNEDRDAIDRLRCVRTSLNIAGTGCDTME